MHMQDVLEAERDAGMEQQGGKASKKKSEKQAAKAAPARRPSNPARGNSKKQKYADEEPSSLTGRHYAGTPEHDRAAIVSQLVQAAVIPATIAGSIDVRLYDSSGCIL